MVKNPPAKAGDAGKRLQSLHPEDHLEKEMATHSSIPAWRIQWIEEPGGLQCMEVQLEKTERLSTIKYKISTLLKY